jgi:hypothetical protein
MSRLFDRHRELLARRDRRVRGANRLGVPKSFGVSMLVANLLFRLSG